MLKRGGGRGGGEREREKKKKKKKKAYGFPLATVQRYLVDCVTLA